MKLLRPLCFLDLESTGVDPVKDRIVELGVVVLHPDGQRTQFCKRFNPGIPIPKEATEIHGITDAMVADCPPFATLARGILAGLQNKDIGTYNGRRLDLPLLDEELRRCRLKLDLTGVHVIDCFGIFSKKEPRKLEDAVRRYCGREHDGAHGAGADAEATLDVFLGQLAAHEDIAAMDLAGMASFSQISEQKYADLAGKLYFDAEGFICYAFGKRKDQRVKDEPGYADWMLNKADFPGSTCDVLRGILYPEQVVS